LLQSLSYFAISISDTHVFNNAAIIRTAQKIKKVLQAVAVLALAAIFISLGWWQLDRARELRAAQNAPLTHDSKTYSLNEIAQASGDLNPDAYGKTVTASGHYIANFKAPNQVSADGTVADWEVALMQTDTSSAILVVRGLWKDRFASPDIVMATNVTITGIIYPHQNDDRAENTPSQLSRLDSSLLTSVSDFQLYDGFIVEQSESYRAGTVTRDRVTATMPKSGIPGYYWQHISYVCIWWLMAALVLWAPFYKRGEEERAEEE
jgi:cytochrome oxidase assembly protein ShyY1